MKDDSFMAGLTVGLLAASVVFIFGVFHTTTISGLVRDCSMTRVHIIDDNTLISCTVLKVNRTETPVQDNKKPEISL